MLEFLISSNLERYGLELKPPCYLRTYLKGTGIYLYIQRYNVRIVFPGTIIHDMGSMYNTYRSERFTIRPIALHYHVLTASVTVLLENGSQRSIYCTDSYNEMGNFIGPSQFDMNDFFVQSKDHNRVPFNFDDYDFDD